MAGGVVVVRAARLLPLVVSCSSSKNRTRPPPRQQQRTVTPVPSSSSSSSLGAAALTAVVPLLAALPAPPDALAVGGELGILEGRTVALLHPAVMGGLFAYTLWAGYLGWQWRRVRTIQDEITELKKQLKPAAAPPPPAPKSPVEIKIDELTEERKKLLKGSFRDRHFNARGVDPAGAGRDGVGRRRAQYLAPHREAVPRPAPVRGGPPSRCCGRPRRRWSRRCRRGTRPPGASTSRSTPSTSCSSSGRSPPAGDRRQGLRVHLMAMRIEMDPSRQPSNSLTRSLAGTGVCLILLCS